jgi:hypothetical protein
MNDDGDREVAIFTEAVEMPTHERAAFLERACSGNKELHHKLEALLSANDRRGDFLEKPAIPADLASLLREITIPAGGNVRRNSEASFQDRQRKRKGR